MNCYHKAFRSEFKIDLDDLEDVRPTGYKVKLQFAIVGNARAKITLQERSKKNRYVIGMIDTNKNNVKIGAMVLI